MTIGNGVDSAAYYSSVNSGNELMMQIGTQILKKTMDAAEIQGAQITRMMEQSVNPGLGANVDIRI